ncbi:hypothetical protein [Pseudobacteriovorax antillogorgiicola]|uniref:Uncharacterized protein n=1 Tax=Pseudobacteriovorax antillogorgiicola TaxID=1513793 RepID=A0A1Y6CJJ4_9BACT|nr:hypothetical protein [Pseudobacteriovorax antillogorgiicola]TCS46185.1 hypothetical protein EDD56_12586 [Pseudobacteriovorax antillogorgiicola]SMF70070.1 hypothetical protein SAMN06296036_12586 [Pseudobacteriovorax antillogorgiicola]
MAKIKTPSSEKELLQKLNRVKLQLEQLQEVKKILLAEGIKPDDDDKRKESKYIQQVLGLEKDLKRLKGPKKPGDGRSPEVPKARSSSRGTKRPAGRA